MSIMSSHRRSSARPPTDRSGCRRLFQLPVLAMIAALGLPLVLAPSASAAGPSRTAVPIEILDLSCTATEGDQPAVQCRWSIPRSDAEGVRVVRRALVEHAPRTVIFRTDDVTQNSVTDEVRAGARYLFVVQAVDGKGRVVAASRPVVVGVAPANAEVLRLDCAQTTAERVSCSWSDPVTEGRTLTLWRSVDGGARSVAASFTNPFPNAYGDGVRSGATSIAYAVIVTDGGGEIVARSRAEIVRLRAAPTTPSTSLAPVETRPEVVQPVETRPEIEPVETRPEVRSEIEPVETRPEVRSEIEPVETRPEVVQPVETRPEVRSDVEPVETRPVRSDSTRGGRD